MFFRGYFQEFHKLTKWTDDIDRSLKQLKKLIIETSERGKKVIIQGNGGSAAMASHFTVDLTKNAGVRAVNFNEPDLITCFANDRGYENWIVEALKFYADEGDLVILVSSSGRSSNIVSACRYCIERKHIVVTFTGMDPENPLKTVNSLGLNFYVNSYAYNLIENVHQFWLLSVVDAIIGKREYAA